MYDHFIGLDWAQSNMAIARLTKKSDKVHVIDVPSDLSELKIYLKNLSGSKILTFEETTTAQWLYVELRDLVDRIVVCDPFRNRLMHEGPKNDKIDATNLAKLLRLGQLKEVFHSGHEFLQLRKLVSGYEDIIKAYVQCANRRSAILRSIGKSKKEEAESGTESFVVEGLDKQIEQLSQERKRYTNEFSQLCKKHKMLRNLKTIPGIDDISAVKIAARVVDINRFPSPKHLWTYCGLIKFEKISGGRSYGKRTPRYSRSLKTIICCSVLNATGEKCKNPLKERYDYLREVKRYSDSEAKTAVRRLLASTIYGVMKSEGKFDPKKIRTVNSK